MKRSPAHIPGRCANAKTPSSRRSTLLQQYAQEVSCLAQCTAPTTPLSHKQRPRIRVVSFVQQDPSLGGLLDA
jgi:hypothetical protein